MATISNGTSRYSSDFQAVIDRAVALATLPRTQLQQTKAQLDDEVTARQSLDIKVGTVQATLGAVETALKSQLTVVSSSNKDSITATVSEGAAAASYTVKVTEAGAYSTAVSTGASTPITDPSAATLVAIDHFTLVIDSDAADADNATKSIVISPAGQTLNDLVAKINAEAGSYVQATIVNAGNGSEPDYRLSLESKKLGAYKFQLLEGKTDPDPASDLLTEASTTGKKAAYTINGLSQTSETPDIEVAPNLTMHIAATGTSTVRVSRSTASVESALKSWVSSFNAAVAAVDENRKEGAALQGNGILATISEGLRRAGAFFDGSGYYKSMADVGLLFDKQGNLYLDSTIFNAQPKDKTKDRFTELKELLGSITTSGFLKQANDSLNSLEQTETGVIKVAITGTRESSADQQKRITVETERIDQLTERLQNQFAEADAMISMLEQQVMYFNGLFDAMKQASESYS
jgi:flagellar hook-associated protein 2